jgi:hypothetical protein
VQSLVDNGHQACRGVLSPIRRDGLGPTSPGSSVPAELAGTPLALVDSYVSLTEPRSTPTEDDDVRLATGLEGRPPEAWLPGESVTTTRAALHPKLP